MNVCDETLYVIKKIHILINFYLSKKILLTTLLFVIAEFDCVLLLIYEF